MLLHDSVGFWLKPSPSKATSRTEIILAAKKVKEMVTVPFSHLTAGHAWQKNVFKLPTKYD